MGQRVNCQLRKIGAASQFKSLCHIHGIAIGGQWLAIVHTAVEARTWFVNTAENTSVLNAWHG